MLFRSYHVYRRIQVFFKTLAQISILYYYYDMKAQISITVDSNLLEVLRKISTREGETLSAIFEDAGYKYLESSTGFWRFDRAIKEDWAQYLVENKIIDTKKYQTRDTIPLMEFLPMILEYDKSEDDEYVKELKEMKKKTKKKI